MPSAPRSPPRFEPQAVLRTLAAHQVRFVVIGGFAAVLHGSGLFTYDADITPDPDPDNLKRLCRALDEIGARIRTSAEPEGAAFRCDEHFLARMSMLNLVTDHGDFDLAFRPAAFPNGFEDLIKQSVPFDVGGFVVQVAALDDVIRSKETADRDKDRAALPQLYALRDAIAAQERDAD
jgi:hypothetical protein